MIRNVIKTPIFFRYSNIHNDKDLFFCYMKLAINLRGIHHHRQYSQCLLYRTNTFEEQTALS